MHDVTADQLAEVLISLALEGNYRRWQALLGAFQCAIDINRAHQGYNVGSEPLAQARPTNSPSTVTPQSEVRDMDGMFLMWLILGPLVGWAIANEKGRGAEGALWGLLLGFIGWIVAALLKPAGEAPVATPRPPETSLPARLQDLERLRRDGVLTPSEYADARSRIIKG